jgi:acyl carrier protein
MPMGGDALDDMRDRVSRVMAQQFHVASDKITESATLDEDLGATSLDRVEVVMSLEEDRYLRRRGLAPSNRG